jgi:phosphinothricin acetyltransferase
MTGLRLANPERDAAQIVDIYRPAIEGSWISFETVVPSTAEMADRIRSVLSRTPWLVAEDGDALLGYAYAAPHRARVAYQWSIEISAYVAGRSHRRGVGTRLYRTLLRILARQGFVNAYAGITLPNHASVRLHESIGMGLVGIYRGIGYKHGAWRDVAWYELRLTDPPGDPPPPIPLPALLADPDDARSIRAMLEAT